MCIALATFEDNIASLFESSNRFVIIQSSPYKIENAESIPIKNNSLDELLHLLKQNNVKILICGALSGCTRRLLTAQKIQVIPWITGDVKSVIEAFQSNSQFTSSFVMPGCRGKRRHERRQFGNRKQHF
jgi:predicted Fe-Mo cluster-binding NifX family protein